jgi:serine/threonine protein phosphatase 1
MKKLTVKIDHADRIFFVGDIHGEITKLNEKLEEVGFDKERDHLFSVGDLIDRGEDSLSCLALIQEEWFRAVRGNHEDLMINAVVNESDNHLACWLQNGSDWYFDLNQEDRMYANDLAKIANDELPYVMEIHHRDKVIVMCHANYPSNDYTGNVSRDDLHDIVWDRSRIDNLKRNKPSEAIKGADLFVFGHTPLRSTLKVDNCLWIDTGAVFGKEMTVIEID